MMLMRKKIFVFLMIIIQMSWAALSQEFEVIFDEDPIETSGDPLTDIKDIPTATDTIRLRIIEKAKEYIGVDYKYGRAGEDGFDCSGYVQYIYDRVGFTIPRSSFEQFTASKPLEVINARPGDLVFFVTRGNRISHVGIYLGDNTFIHSPSRGKKVCVESLDSGFFKKHLVGYGTILGSTY
jgi:cell wall-associated NlpC family hydrolase